MERSMDLGEAMAARGWGRVDEREEVSRSEMKTDNEESEESSTESNRERDVP
jgi:hypothetical protein